MALFSDAKKLATARQLFSDIGSLIDSRSSVCFNAGSTHICQVVASKYSAKGVFGMPLTRADLFT